MSTVSGVEVHLPPKFNLEGRRQLWFVETESGWDEGINGALTGILVFTPLILLRVFI